MYGNVIQEDREHEPGACHPCPGGQVTNAGRRVTRTETFIASSRELVNVIHG